MARRANGEGTVYQRQDGRWTAATYVLRPDGGRQRKQIYGKTRAEVSTKLRELLSKTDRGIPLAGTVHTVDSFAEHWKRLLRSSSLRPSTQANYEYMLRKHIVPTLGRVRLEQLTTEHVRRLIRTVAATGVSARTQQLAHAVLRAMLAEAMREEVVARNVAALVKAPRPQRDEVKPWCLDEVRRFESVASTHPLHALFTLAYSTGMRRGELLGLRFRDVELDTSRVHVRQTLQRLGAGRGLVLGPPKSARSRRSVPMAEFAAEVLGRHLARQRREFGGAPDDLVFTTSLGTPIEPSNLRRTFLDLIGRAEVTPIRFHDLRHTAASLLLAQGVPARVVMDVLGHSALSITTDLYSHVMPEALGAAAVAMEAALRSEP